MFKLKQFFCLIVVMLCFKFKGMTSGMGLKRGRNQNMAMLHILILISMLYVL